MVWLTRLSGGVCVWTNTFYSFLHVVRDFSWIETRESGRFVIRTDPFLFVYFAEKRLNLGYNVILILDYFTDEDHSMSQSNQTQTVLGYWAIRGLAEPSRLALHYSKTPYTDKFYVQGEGPEYSREEWLQEKPKLGLGKAMPFVSFPLDSSPLDFPNLPYLFDGDVKITQSKAILYYLGRKFHLMGKTLAEEAYVMMLCEQAHDFRITINGAFYGPKGATAEDRKAFVETTVVEELKKFEDYFAKHQGKFAVGNQVTIADFQLFDYLDAGLTLDETNTVLEKFPNIKRFLHTIRELPELKEYIAKVQGRITSE